MKLAQGLRLVRQVQRRRDRPRHRGGRGFEAGVRRQHGPLRQEVAATQTRSQSHITFFTAGIYERL